MSAPTRLLRVAVGRGMWTMVLVASVGCGDGVTFGSQGQDAIFDGQPLPPPPTDERPVVRASQTPLPIYGGTLDVLDAGDTAIVSDPDRDQVYVVDLEARVLRATIELQDGDVPWRTVEDDEGRVHVVLRGSGEVATIDPVQAKVLARRAACPNPRGLAADEGMLWVTCAGGAVVTMPTAPEGTGAQIAVVDKDLRDVIVSDGFVLASRFRSTELAIVSGDEPSLFSSKPPRLGASGAGQEPAVAWRTRPTGKGWLMLHQYAQDVDPLSLRALPNSWGGTSGPGPCDAPVNGAVTLFTADGEVVSTGRLDRVVAPVDVALSPDGDFLMIASVGNGGENLRTLSIDDLVAKPKAGDCRRPKGIGVDAPVAGVDFTPEGLIVAALYDPAELLIIDGRRDERTRIKLASGSLEDTGHLLFHVDAGPGVACVSCHPDGGDDGRVWQTDDGPRRTQPLDAGLAGTAPFHWNGEEADFRELIDETLVRRMGGRPQSAERAQAFEEWVMAIPDVAPVRTASDAAALRGASAFVALGCVECHRGASTTRPDSIAFAGLDAMQVPMLLGVATRGPFMHDGRAATLRDAVVDMLEQTDGPNASDGDIDDVVAYLESL